VADAPEDEVLLGGFEISGGSCISSSSDPFPTPDFVLHFTHEGYELAITDREMIPAIFMAGDAFIGANSTVVPGPLLFQAAVAVTFGFGAVPPPGCPGDADGSGIVDFADISAVLANWGQSGLPYRPGDADGSGTVDFADISTVLANWGSNCP